MDGVARGRDRGVGEKKWGERVGGGLTPVPYRFIRSGRLSWGLEGSDVGIVASLLACCSLIRSVAQSKL